MPDNPYPRIVGPPLEEHIAELNEEVLREAGGKTISRAEIGRVKNPDPNRVHEGEALVLYFTNGTALAVEIGSNAWNLAQEFEDLSPGDFHTNLRPERNRDWPR